VLEHLDLDIMDGEFLVLLGPSGCGKSTLLNCIAGLIDVSDGQIFINGWNVTWEEPKDRHIGMVFQSYALYPQMTVRRNLSFGLRSARVPDDEIQKRIARTAEILQIQPLLDRKPSQLSGGQRQRVAIGRAMLRDPQVFLFDEPLSNLDAALRVQTRLQIAQLHQDTGRSMIYVTHDQVEAMTLADKIVLLNTGERIAREGSLAQVGTPLALYHHPRSLFVAGFIGAPRMNFLSARAVEVFFDRLVAETASGLRIAAAVCGDGVKIGDPLTLGIRPEHVTFGDTLSAGVLNVERFGDSSLLYLECADAKEPIIMRTDGGTRLKRGDFLRISLPPEHAHAFAGDGRALVRSTDPLSD
jgi:ABC-type sugar transport system ATPase subunit